MKQAAANEENRQRLVDQRQTARPRVSVVAPVYNEQGNIRPLISALQEVFQRLADEADFEIVLVDDGSADSTWAEVVAVAADVLELKALRLSRNFGHQNALLAGLFNTEGDVVITMDGDLQHPPELIPELLANWRLGYDVVNTERVDIGENSLFKRKSSHFFYHVFSRLTEVRLTQGTSDFRLMDKKVLNSLLMFNDVRMFFRGAVAWVGFSTLTVPYRLQPRHSGTTKYPLKRMLGFAGSAIVSFSTVPLKIGIFIGFLTSLLAFAELSWVIAQYFRGITVPGWASTLGIVSLLFGVLFILLGTMGLYVSRIHEALQGRPRFLISESTSGRFLNDR